MDRLVPEGFCACPVDIAFNVMGKKWTVLLIRNMLKGQRHFNEFLAHIPGLNPRTLSTRLKELEQEQLVERIARASPISVEYQLTEKGQAVLPILEQMVRWSVTYAPDRVFGDGVQRDVDECLEAWENLVVQDGRESPSEPRTRQARVRTSGGPLTDSAEL